MDPAEPVQEAEPVISDTILKLTSPTKKSIALCGGLILASIFIPAISYLIIIIFLAAFIGRFKKFSLIEAIMFSVLGAFSFFIMLYALITAMHASLPLHYAPALLAFLIASTLFLKKTTRGEVAWVSRPKSDAAALAALIITFCLLLVPVAFQPPARIAQFMSYGEDNASHYALTRYAIQNGSFTYNESSKAAGLVDSLEIYPQGFHMNAGIVISLLKPLTITESKLLKVYALFVAALYALMTFWIVKLCFVGIQKISWKTVIGILPGIVLVGALGPLLLMLDRGFQPQIFCFAFMLAIIYLLSRSERSAPTPNQVVFSTLLLSIGIAFSWWFLLVPIFILLLFYVLRDGRLKKIIRSLRKDFLLKSLIVFTILYPILVNILLSRKNNPLNEPGGVDILPLDAFIYLLIVIAAAFILRLMTVRRLAYILIGLVGSVFLAVFIGAYHLISVGHFEYYFHKTMYAILIFVVILFAVAAFRLSETIIKKFSGALQWCVPVVILVLTISICLATNLVYVKVYVNNWFPNAVEIADTPILFSPATEKYDDIIYLGDCIGASDYLSNRWSGARLLSESFYRGRLSTSLMNHDWKMADYWLVHYLNSKPQAKILLTVDRRCDEKLPTLNQLDQFKNITTVYTH